MRVLIVAPKYTPRRGDFYQFPLGLGYIISALKRERFEVHCLNCNESDDATGSQVERAVRQLQPDICATGALSPFLPQVQDIFAAARRARPSITNIAGGGVLSSDPEAGPQVMDIDIGVIGEGEHTIVDTVRTLESGGDLGQVAGIVYKNAEGRIIRTMPRPAIKDLGSIAWPDYEALGFGAVIDQQRASDNYFYQSKNRPRAIDMITSRSCPYRCTFCFHPTGKVYRERPLDDFFAELDQIVKLYDINMVALIDELFSLKRARLLEFCDRIEPYRLNWMVQLHVNCADDHILKRMKEAGASYISYGIESMSQAVLISMQKKSKKERIHEVLGNTYRYQIGIQGNLIFGDSAETLDTANESMRWWAENRKYKVWINRLLVYPGSPDYIQAVRDGLITDRVRFIEDQAVSINISKLNDTDLQALTRKVAIAQRTLLDLARVSVFEKEPEVHPLRGESYHIQWQCPRCEIQNDYTGVLLQPEEHRYSLFLTCRGCASRHDIRTPAAMQLAGREPKVQDDEDFAAALELLRQGATAEARQRLEGIAARSPWHHDAHLELAKLHRQAGNRLLASRHSGLAVFHHPYRADLHLQYADCLLWEGAVGLARLHCLQVLKLEPGHTEAARMLARIDGAEYTDAERGIYFVSYSDLPAPVRLHDTSSLPSSERRKNETEFPDIARLELEARQELASAGRC